MTFLEQWFEEVWNKGRQEAIDAMALPHAKIHGLRHPDGTEVEGLASFKAFHKQFYSSFSDLHIHVEHTVTEGNMTMAHCVATGVHTGDGLGLPATGRPVRMTGMCLVRLEDGLIAEAWNNFDLDSLFRQVGGRHRLEPASMKDAAPPAALLNWP